MQHALTVQHENRHYWNIKKLSFWISNGNLSFTRSRFWCPQISPYLQWIYESTVSLIWRAEPGKYINNDTRERKSWNPAGKKFWPRVEWRKEKSPRWYISLCMSLKFLIHDERFGRSVVTNLSPRATQPPPSWRWRRWRCKRSWTERICPSRKAANWMRYLLLWLWTRRLSAWVQSRRLTLPVKLIRVWRTSKITGCVTDGIT